MCWLCEENISQITNNNGRENKFLLRKNIETDKKGLERHWNPFKDSSNFKVKDLKQMRLSREPESISLGAVSIRNKLNVHIYSSSVFKFILLTIQVSSHWSMSNTLHFPRLAHHFWKRGNVKTDTQYTKKFICNTLDIIMPNGISNIIFIFISLCMNQ